ncbi:MAG: hypothetical protein HRT77_02045 [Halioglobus sp.]|nr:hypothetical protein [Halioglobus sp.]
MDIPVELKGKEISLEHLHLSEVAWHRDDALKPAKHLGKVKSVILGGDVLARDTDGYRHNYDNWYLKPDNAGSAASVEQTINYIHNYPEGDYVFVFVVA